MNKQTTSPKHPNRLKLFIILAIVILILIASVVAVMLLNKPKQSPSSRKKIIELLTQNTGQTKQQRITSDLGFTVPYDSAQIDAEGIVQNPDSAPGTFQGKTYSGDELKEKRSYGIITLRLKSQPVLETESQLLKMHSHLTIVSNRNKNYFGQKDSIKEYAGKSNLDVLTIEKRKSLAGANPNDEITERTVTISGKEYRELKVAHRTKALNGQYITLRHSYYYMTVQNDRPYWLSIYDVQGHNKEELAIWQGVIAATTYASPGNNALTKRRLSAQLAEAKAPTDTANIRDSISDETMINVVAKNQLATVRVGAGRCADLTFRANGQSLTLAHTCVFMIGSGSIISGDGLVATNGHVTKVHNEELAQNAWPSNQAEWDAHAKFVVGAGYATWEEMRDLRNRGSRGDKDAVQKLAGYLKLVPKDGISVANDQTDFVVQTSDEPIRLKNSSWIKTATNKPAKVIDQEVGPEGSLSTKSPYTDVALLKMEGVFPTVHKLASLSDVKTGEDMTAIGYPAVVDGGAHTKRERTVPTVTHGRATEEMRDAGNHRLMVMSTQIASGNSGGPAFNKQGEQVGLNTYGGATCSGEESGNSCFGRGIARDGKDIQTMAEKNQVRIDTNGELAQLWQRGLDDFAAGRYKNAAKSFTELNNKYPDNYIVKKFLTTAESQPHDETDQTDEQPSTTDDNGDQSTIDSDLRGSITKSNDNLTLIIVISVVSVIVLCIVGIIIAVVVARRRTKTATPPVMSPAVYPVNPMVPPQQPATTWAPQQQVQYQPQQPPVTPPAQTVTLPQQYPQYPPQPGMQPPAPMAPAPAGQQPVAPAATPQPPVMPSPQPQPQPPVQQPQSPINPAPVPTPSSVPQQPPFQGPPDKTN